MTPMQRAFVLEYLLDLNATQAAIRAGYSEKNADKIGPELLGKTRVAAAIEAAMAQRAKRTEINADYVLKRLVAIDAASAAELIEVRRTCCRFCHGKRFKYQRTQGELDRARAGWQHLATQAAAAGSPAPPPIDDEGGIGYNATKRPHPDCPECFGEGVLTPFAKETRDLSENARLLYAGVKVTKDGIGIKMRNQDAALLNIAKHLGMFVNKHEHTGPDGGAIPITFVEFADHDSDPAAV
jgi:hypothetical protein